MQDSINLYILKVDLFCKNKFFKYTKIDIMKEFSIIELACYVYTVPILIGRLIKNLSASSEKEQNVILTNS